MLNVTYVCNGERIYVESCNIRDLSDNATCMVGHPDRLHANGFMAYTNETRGALKKLFPTCTPAHAQATRRSGRPSRRSSRTSTTPTSRRPTSRSNAASRSPDGNRQLRAANAPKNAEERAMRRCVTSGTLPATCTGNSLLGGFGQMISQVLPGRRQRDPPPAPTWRASSRAPATGGSTSLTAESWSTAPSSRPIKQSYTLDFKNGRTVLTINTTPKPLVLTLRADGTITGPGPVTIDGVVATGYAAVAPPRATPRPTRPLRRDVSQSQTGTTANPSHLPGQRHYDAATTHTTSTYVPGTSTPATPPSPTGEPPAPRSTSPRKAPASAYRPCKPIC